MSYLYRREPARSHFADASDPGAYRRILTPEQAQRVVAMRGRGMTWPAIALWFTNNVRPVSWQAVRAAHERAMGRSFAA